MCGINGIAFSSRNGGAVSPDLLARMRDTLRHRGPDDSGLFIDGGIGLAHRRLSIVDIAAGHQPMANEDGSVQIVYNGEIYNHADHRAQLEAQGHVFATHSDTETIVHLYEQHGSRCVDYLRGMFGFAIWDRRSKVLFLARDRLGVKPLYYVATQDGSLFFASEIKSLLAAGAVKPELNKAALPDFLANRTTSDDSTLFVGVRRLPAGHTMMWRDGVITIEKYWEVPTGRTVIDDSRNDSDYVAEWLDLFKASVKLRLMADVPLGMFLSGGIDSSAIAAVMSKMVSDPIKTFSMAFDVPEANELSYARQVAKAMNTDHHEVMVAPSDFMAALPHLVWHEDEPIAHSASVALYFVSQLAQRYVKVVLTGEGSDELLAGYYRYRTTLLNLSAGSGYHAMTSESVRGLIRGALGRVAPNGLHNKLQRTFLWRNPNVDELYFDNFAVFPRAAQAALLSDQLKSELVGIDPYVGMNGFFSSAGGDPSLLQRLLYTDIKTYLHELLMKQDQMSMAASIESRVPFLDHKLVEHSAMLPDRMKLRGWTTKWILREAMQGVLPDTILKRPKMGFPVPLPRWLRGEFQWLLDEYVTSDRALGRGLFNESAVRQLVVEHKSVSKNHADKLWLLINLEIWQRIFIDGELPQGALPQLQEAKQ